MVTVRFTAQRNCRILVFGGKLAGFVFLGEGGLLLSSGVLMWDQFRHGETREGRHFLSVIHILHYGGKRTYMYSYYRVIGCAYLGTKRANTALVH